MATTKNKALYKQVQASTHAVGRGLIEQALKAGRLSVSEYKKLQKYNDGLTRKKPVRHRGLNLFGVEVSVSDTQDRGNAFSTQELRDLRNELLERMV